MVNLYVYGMIAVVVGAVIIVVALIRVGRLKVTDPDEYVPDEDKIARAYRLRRTEDGVKIPYEPTLRQLNELKALMTPLGFSYLEKDRVFVRVVHSAENTGKLFSLLDNMTLDIENLTVRVEDMSEKILEIEGSIKDLKQKEVKEPKKEKEPEPSEPIKVKAEKAPEERSEESNMSDRILSALKTPKSLVQLSDQLHLRPSEVKGALQKLLKDRAIAKEKDLYKLNPS